MPLRPRPHFNHVVGTGRDEDKPARPVDSHDPVKNALKLLDKVNTNGASPVRNTPVAPRESTNSGKSTPGFDASSHNAGASQVASPGKSTPAAAPHATAQAHGAAAAHSTAAQQAAQQHAAQHSMGQLQQGQGRVLHQGQAYSSGLSLYEAPEGAEQLGAETPLEHELPKDGRPLSAPQRAALAISANRYLSMLSRYNPSGFNFYQPGMADHVDQAPLEVRSKLQETLERLTAGASKDEIKGLAPTISKLMAKITFINDNMRPPRAAARPGKDLSQRLGTRNAPHHLDLPTDGY